ncbi:hypothetical protein JYQ29_14575 [Curtobacterium flaccumfaciens pv. flaccumfaciens]|uniref:alpha/beta hydrolase n=1 Tax=Curtobacterium flaccumfaciens TaxID=2035 RepID=UPI001ADC8411|nr:alpha/beta hydrolase-fold protein [Curtobacterium flaccumfaciens]MBO9048763.1 hypothetical protein [Curtobacterium flaccumfaciens pv. flaccumfaciens]MBO9058209.1 hypothetical protein [Curtobacterium flaccumfaciens pv. flaccumfaciens]QTR89999.1 hypothetical protein JG550_002691 [Curtobacterium flaccumfaciens pv. flaccumfaciens]
MFHDLLRPLFHVAVVAPSVLVPVDVAAGLLTVAALLPAFGRHSRHPVRGLLWRLGAMAVGAVLGLVAVWWFGDVQDLYGVSFTPITRMWVALAFGGVGLLVVTVVQGGWLRRVLGVLAAVAVALAAVLGVNVDFGAYRTIEQAVTTDPYPSGPLGHETGVGRASSPVVDPATWRAPAGMPRRGKVLSVTIPSTVSHFHARPAVVYLPPAALTERPPTLPVVISLAGQPGQPSDMFQAGRLGAVMDAFAEAHHGLAPIVVAPDQLGAPDRNPMCVDSSLGRSATYIMTDTTNWIRQHLRVGAAPSAWGIVGFSQGATCAMQFSTAHPNVFGTTFAISSELAPLNGSVQHSIRYGFGGSASRYAAAAPRAIMRAHGPYPGHLTVFAYGSDDAPYVASTTALRTAAEAAGMQTRLFVSEGSAHDWNTVRYALRVGMPGVIAHLGLR